MEKNVKEEDKDRAFIVKHLSRDPKLVEQYVFHSDIGGALQAMIIRSKNLAIIKNMFANASIKDNYFAPEAQDALLETEDTDFIVEVMGYAEMFPASFVCKIIAKENTTLFSALFAEKPSKPVEFSFEAEEKLLSLNNGALWEIYLKHFPISFNMIEKIISNNNVLLFEKVIAYSEFDDNAQAFLAKNGSLNMIASYIKKHAFVCAAQIVLVDKNYKDLMALHYKLYGMHRETLSYFSHLNSFRQYINSK